MGPLFQFIRSAWKSLTKTTKRKGLSQIKFSEVKNNRLKEFL